jgi:hypothetical protein
MTRPIALSPIPAGATNNRLSQHEPFGLTSMKILHSSGIRLTNVRSRPKRK